MIADDSYGTPFIFFNCYLIGFQQDSICCIWAPVTESTKFWEWLTVWYTRHLGTKFGRLKYARHISLCIVTWLPRIKVRRCRWLRVLQVYNECPPCQTPKFPRCASCLWWNIDSSSWTVQLLLPSILIGFLTKSRRQISLNSRLNLPMVFLSAKPSDISTRSLDSQIVDSHYKSGHGTAKTVHVLSSFQWHGCFDIDWLSAKCKLCFISKKRCLLMDSWTTGVSTSRVSLPVHTTNSMSIYPYWVSSRVCLALVHHFSFLMVLLAQPFWLNFLISVRKNSTRFVTVSLMLCIESASLNITRHRIE